MEDPTRRGSGVRLALDAWGRRKWLAIVTFAGLFTAAISVATFLPGIYRSTATVLVERQEVPETFVRPAVTGELETRLQTLSQQILSRARLNDLIDRFDLYPKLRREVPAEVVVERMRRDIQLELRSVEQTGGRGATIAFALSYQGRDSRTVAQVTNTLASFYVDENSKIRERQTTGTAEFLKTQLDALKKELDERERRIAEFKTRYMGELPQQVGANLATLDRFNAQLRLNSEQRFKALERRQSVIKQMAEADGVVPDPTAEPLAARVAKLGGELTELRTRVTDKHPDVVRVKAELAALERQRAQVTGGPTAGDSTARADRADRLLTETLREVDRELEGLRDEEKKLREVIAAYQRRVEEAPRRQQEIEELSRGYETAKERYYSLLKRYEDAQLAESLEQRKQGEKFRTLDAAVPATTPAMPNRLRLGLMGLMLSAATAAALVLLAERLDSLFHSVDELRAFTKVPVVASIPRIAIRGDRLRRVGRVALGALAVGVGLVLIVAISYYIAHDNERLVWMLTRAPSA
ncbi:MAG: hypothetical protein HY359_04750 [Candidatus Rokubacteria bacterium]|nr:hypothetical protein [Candidatus Rokubacteria bacterium]